MKHYILSFVIFISMSYVYSDTDSVYSDTDCKMWLWSCKVVCPSEDACASARTCLKKYEKTTLALSNTCLEMDQCKCQNETKKTRKILSGAKNVTTKGKRSGFTRYGPYPPGYSVSRVSEGATLLPSAAGYS